MYPKTFFLTLHENLIDFFSNARHNVSEMEMQVEDFIKLLWPNLENMCPKH